jgi:hypothetical protein
MKLLRIVAVVALTALGSITGGASVVHATPATGVLLGASTVKTLQTPTIGAFPLEKAYYYYRRHYWHPYYHRRYWHRHYYHRHYWHRRYW